MLTPRLPPPFLIQDILSIPDMMQHSPQSTHQNHGFLKKKKKRISHPVLLVFSVGAEKPACSLEKDEETNVLLIAL